MAKNNFEVGFVFGAHKAASFDKTFKGINSSIKGIAQGITGIASAYVGFSALKGAIDIFSTFEQSMAGVQAVSGATISDFNAMEKAALGLKNAKPQEGAEALGYMAAAGWDAQKSIAGLEPMINLAKAGELDLATASDLATSSMAAMGIEVSDMTIYLDKATKAGAASNASTQQMLEAYTNVGGKLQSMNVGLEESGALLGVMANRGLRGSEAGNSLNAILTNLTQKTGASAEAMKALGVSAFAGGKFKGAEAVFLEVQQALSGLSEEQQIVYKDMIAGKNNASGFNAILSGMANEYSDLKGEIYNADGAMGEMAGTMGGTMKGAMGRFGVATDQLKIKVVKTFEKGLTGAINGVSDALQSMASSAAFERIGVSVGKGLTTVIGGARQIATTVIPIVTNLKDHAVKAFEWISDIAHRSFGRIKAVVSESAEKFQAFGSAVSNYAGTLKNVFVRGLEAAKPIIEWIAVEGLPGVIGVLGVVAGKAAEYYQLLTGFYQFIVDNWSAIKPIVIGIGAAFALWKLPNVLLTATNSLVNFGGAVIGLPAKLAMATAAQLGHVKAIISDKVMSLQLVGLYAKDLAASIWGNVKAVGASTAAWISNKAALIGQKAAALGAKAVGIASTMWQTVKAVGASTAAWVANKAILVGQKVAMLALKGAQLVSTGITAGLTAAQWALNAAFIASPIGWIVLGIGALIAVGVLLWKNWDVVKAKAIELWNGMKGAFGSAVGWFKGIWDGVVAGFQNFMTGLSAQFPMLANLIMVPVNTIKGILDGLKTTFTGITTFVSGVFTGDWGKAWEGVKGIFSGVFQSFSSIAKTPINAVIAIINGAIRGINGINVEVPDWVPGMGGKTFGFAIPEIPALAQGGIATAPTLAMVGEGKEKEAILPLSKLEGMLQKEPGQSTIILAPIIPYLKMIADGLKAGYKGIPNSAAYQTPEIEKRSDGSGLAMSPVMTILQKLLDAIDKKPPPLPPNITYSPQIIIQGNAKKEDVEEALDAGYEKFKEYQAAYEWDKSRTGLKK